jgi:tellurite resistance protein
MQDRSPHDSLANIPPGLFSATLGLSGVALAWSKAADLDLVDPAIGFGLGLLAAAILSVATAALGAKALIRPAASVSDFSDPNRLAPYGAGAISLMGIGGIVAAKSLTIGLSLWYAGVLAEWLISIVFCARLLAGRWSFNGANPLWLIAAVGPIAAPAAGVSMGQDLISGLMFGQGLMGLALLLPALIVRIAFHDHPPKGGGMVVLLTPPGLGCVSLIALSGGVDHSAHAVFGAALLIFVCLVVRLPALLARPHSLALWATIFPTANFAIAGFQIGATADAPALIWLALGLTVVISLASIAIMAWTVSTAWRFGFTAQGLASPHRRQRARPNPGG